MDFIHFKINLFNNLNKKMLIYVLLSTLLFSTDDPVLNSIFEEASKRGIPKDFLEDTFNKNKIIIHEKIPDFFARPYEGIKSFELINI